MALPSLTAPMRRASDCAEDTGVDLQAAFDRYDRSLYRYLAVRTGQDVHLADDLMQQLWLQIGTASSNVPPDEVEFFLRRIAANLIREHWRRAQRRPEHVPIADAALAAALSERLATEELPVDVLTRREIRDQLLLAITDLGSEDQELIAGHYFAGQSHAALAAALGVGERAVEGRLYRARQRLRETLKNLNPLED